MLDQTTYAQWTGALLGEYRLTRLLSMSPLGPLFVADSVNSLSTFLVRVLTVPPAQTSDAMAAYQGYLERQAGHIITLRHPYILPLVNYGLYQGMPYFVWPYTSMRSLTTRLTQSGVLDVVTMGRYLDQIAAALEFAHQNATFNRNLSLDCIYLQLDGQIAIADFGVRRLYELLTPGGQTGFFAGSLEACAPEQLTGGQIGSYTDVYALGAITYRLLTGHSVFSGENFRALAEQHLRASPPSLARMRAGLPIALDRVLAGALAKDPAQRLQHPGAFADAYHQIVAPDNTRRVPFDAPGGAFGASMSAIPQLPQSQGPSQPSALRPGGGTPSGGYSGYSGYPAYSGGRADVVSAPVRGSVATATPESRSFFARSGWFFLLALVLIPLISAGAFFVLNNRPGAGGPSGTLLFVDTATTPDGSNDGLRLTARGLAAPASGSQYEVWLVNQQTEQILALGKLTSGPDQTYQLVYAPNGVSGKPGANILSEGDMVEITEEQSNVAAPSGKVLLAVKFPPVAFVHIKHLLLTFNTTPGKIGLLVGVLRQTQLLNAQATALSQAVGSGQGVLVQCLAQSIIDISEGSQGAHYKQLGPACAAVGVTDAGDGFGLLSAAKPTYGQKNAASGYIKNAADHASLAINTPDVTDAIRQHASGVESTLAEVTKSVSAANSAALTLLKTPTDTAAVAKLLDVSGQAYHGSGNGTAGGARSAYQQGQQMATLELIPGVA